MHSLLEGSVRNALVQFSWGGLARAAMEFISGRNIFLMSLFNGREIMEGSNIFIKNSVSP